jgi:hypothetical protein
MPPLPQPAWLVVSSELDLNSAAAIGWPLDAGAEPAQTFDVADQLLLDGLPAAFQTRPSTSELGQLLRLMLERATGVHRDVVDDRFVVETRFRAARWEVVVEPDEGKHLLVVVTAYPVEP